MEEMRSNGWQQVQMDIYFLDIHHFATTKEEKIDCSHTVSYTFPVCLLTVQLLLWRLLLVCMDSEVVVPAEAL